MSGTTSEERLPPPARVDVSKYRIDSDADSEEPVEERVVAAVGPAADAAAAEEAERAAEAAKRHAELDEQRRQQALREAENRPPMSATIDINKVRIDSDADEDDSDDSPESSDGHASASAAYPKEEPCSAAAATPGAPTSASPQEQHHAATPTPATGAEGDGESEDAPKTTAQPARVDGSANTRPKAGAATTNDEKKGTTMRKAKSDVVKDKFSNVKKAEAGGSAKKAERPTETASNEPKTLETRAKGRVANKKDMERGVDKGPETEKRAATKTKTAAKPKVTKKADFSADAKPKKVKTVLPPAAARSQSRDALSEASTAPPAVEDPNVEAARRSTARRRNKDAAVREQRSTGAGSAGNRKGRFVGGGEPEIVTSSTGVVIPWATRDPNVPTIVRRTSGGAGGVRAVGDSRNLVNGAPTAMPGGSAGVPASQQHQRVYCPSAGSRSGAAGTGDTLPSREASSGPSPVNVSQRHRRSVSGGPVATATTGAAPPVPPQHREYASTSRSRATPVAAGAPVEQTSNPAAMQGFLATLENANAAAAPTHDGSCHSTHGRGTGGLDGSSSSNGNGEAGTHGANARSLVNVRGLPRLPPPLITAVVAHYESCLLQLPQLEVEQVVACMCAERDRKAVLAYLRQKQKLLRRRQQRQRNTNIALETQRQRAVAEGGTDASRRGVGRALSPPSATGGDASGAGSHSGLAVAYGGYGSDGSHVSAVSSADSFKDVDPVGAATLAALENNAAVASYKSFFTQQSCAAFLEENIEACIARRERYYENQPAIVRAKRGTPAAASAENVNLRPLYVQVVNATLYQMLSLTESECSERKFTEPVVDAVMARMPVVAAASAADGNNSASPAYTGAAAAQQQGQNETAGVAYVSDDGSADTDAQGEANENDNVLAGEELEAERLANIEASNAALEAAESAVQAAMDAVGGQVDVKEENEEEVMGKEKREQAADGGAYVPYEDKAEGSEDEQ